MIKLNSYLHFVVPEGKERAFSVANTLRPVNSGNQRAIKIWTYHWGGSINRLG